MIFKNPFKKQETPAPVEAAPVEVRIEKVQKKEAFLEEPHYGHLKKQPVYHVYRFIYANPVDPRVMEKNGMNRINSKLYTFVTVMVREAINSFYMVPAVRGYFGDAFVKNFTCFYSRGEEYIVFPNMEEDELSIRFSKELVLYIARMMKPWMDKKDIFISWRLDGFQFITREKAESTNKWLIDENERIVWVPA